MGSDISQTFLYHLQSLPLPSKSLRCAESVATSDFGENASMVEWKWGGGGCTVLIAHFFTIVGLEA